MGRMISKIKQTGNSRSRTYLNIPQEILKEANSKISLVDLIGQTISLSQSSKGQWKGLCPFHNEKTPSFFVNEEKGYYHCFGCNESGNAINFLMKVQGMTFKQAASKVLQLAGFDSYENSDWIQSESTFIIKSIEKTIETKINEENNNEFLDNIYESLFYISETCFNIVKNNPELFDKMEELYLKIDDNYKFKNYERIYDICKDLIKIIKEMLDVPKR